MGVEPLCLICKKEPLAGVLCAGCLRELGRPVDMIPEQIESEPEAPLDAGLIDPWGRLHRLDEVTLVSRSAEDGGLSIFESSISRRHAELRRSSGRSGFSIRDLGSTNGTAVGARALGGQPAELSSGDIVLFGRVAFFFLAPVESPAELEPQDAGAALPELPIQIADAPAREGGVLSVGSKIRVELTRAQREIMAALIERMSDELDRPAAIRGFATTGELLAEVRWESERPSQNHLKQLVRRLRRTLERSGAGDLIEARRGFGYRLRVTPIDRPRRV